MYAVSEFIRGALTGPRFLPLLFLLISGFCLPSSAFAACANPVGVEGQMLYNGTSHVMQYCNNLNVWRALDPVAGAGGAGCSGPAGAEGTMMYNKTYHMLQWCDGTTWKAVAGPTSYNTGLVGWWKFDEGSGTTAADSQGTNNGTLVNSPTWTLSGKINGALTFNGTNQYVDAGNGSSLNLGSTGSVAAWAKFAVVGDGVLISKDNNGTDLNGYAVWPDDAGGFAGEIANASSNNQIHSTTTYDDGNWHHVVFTWNGSWLNLYVDGAVAATPVAQTLNPVSNVYNLQFGKDVGSGCCYYTGPLDDVRVWNRALSASEVLALYNDTSGYNIPGVPTSGLVGWWKFDETSGTSAADSSGNANTGTVTPNATGVWVAGKINNAAHLNGTTQYVNVPDAASLRLAGSWTLSVWVNPTGGLPTSGNDVQIACKQGNSNGANYCLQIDNGAWSGYGWEIMGQNAAAIWNEASSDSSCCSQITLNTWYNLVGVYDSVANYLYIYVNGVLKGSSPATYAPWDTSAGQPLAIGYWGAGGVLYFHGTIDDARVYNRALSATEILNLYNITSPNGLGCVDDGLVGWWKMDETSGTSAADSSGNGNTGTLHGGMSWVAGKINGAVQSNGASGAYVVTPSINLGSTKAVTVSMWANRTYSGANTTLFEFSSNYNTAPNPAYAFFPDDAADCPSAQIMVGIDGNHGYTLNCYTQPSSGVWHHLVAVYDMTRTDQTAVSLYIDGVLQTVLSNPYGYVTNNNDGETFGNFPFYMFSRGGASQWNAGTVDDVRVYNRALSGAEVMNLYNGIGTAVEGQTIYNSTTHKPQFCDGTAWHKTR